MGVGYFFFFLHSQDIYIGKQKKWRKKLEYYNGNYNKLKFEKHRGQIFL